MKELKQMNLPALLALYMEEAKAFSAALNRGESWEALQEKRIHIQLLNELITKKRQQSPIQQDRRRTDLPPESLPA